MKKIYTGYCDITGTKIYFGDILEFKDKHSGAIWRGMVDFEDGYPTVSILDIENIKNPDDWKEKHSWINSRWWSVQVGYGEFGTWNCARAPLVKIAGYFPSSEEMFEVRNKFNEKYGRYHSNDHLERELPIEIVGHKDFEDWRIKKIPYFQEEDNSPTVVTNTPNPSGGSDE